MTASLAISSAALAQSSAALSRAKAAECRAFMPTYDPATATPDVMRFYADCVERLYPAAMEPSTVLFFKVMIVVALIGLALGLWKAYRDAYGWGDMLALGLGYGALGSAIGPAIMGAIALVGAGVMWVLS